MFVFLQVLCVFILFVIFIYVGKILRKPIPLVTGLSILLLLASLLSGAILNLIPMPTEQIILTATGEKNDLALNNEIALSGVIADGKIYEVKNAVEGKWFWQGDNYMWRNEDDTRQPEGTTRSITLNIPVGDCRALIFNNNPYRGIVEITYENESQTYDLYSDKTENVNVYVPSSNQLYDDVVKIGRLALFVGFILVLMTCPICIVIKYDYKIIKKVFEKHWDKFYYFCLAVLYLFIMQRNSVEGSLWVDEMWQLAWTYGAEKVYKTYVVFQTLSDLWFFIMPYGQEHLLLLSQLFVVGSIYVAGLIGYSLNGKRLGIILSSMVAFSLPVVYQCSMEIRAYAMLLFCTTLLLYLFICKHRKTKKLTISEILFYGFVVTLTMDSHQFGFLVGGLFLLTDFILIVLKKTPRKNYLEFILPCAYGLWWLCVQDYRSMNSYGSTSWAGEANAAKVFNTMKWLCSNNELLLLILIGSVVMTLTCIVYKLIEGEFDFNLDFINLVMIFIPASIVCLVWFYSACINPDNTLFLDRYFISIEIFICYFISLGLNTCIDFVNYRYKFKILPVCCVLFILCSLCVFNWTKISPWEMFPAADRTSNFDYKTAAEYLMKQNDIYDISTICIVDDNEYINIGFEYYLSKKGRNDSINHMNMWEISLTDLKYNVIYITNLRRGYASNPGLDRFLNENYSLINYDSESKVYKFEKSIKV